MKVIVGENESLCTSYRGSCQVRFTTSYDEVVEKVGRGGAELRENDRWFSVTAPKAI